MDTFADADRALSIRIAHLSTLTRFRGAGLTNIFGPCARKPLIDPREMIASAAGAVIKENTLMPAGTRLDGMNSPIAV
jgi:hypothetical protein